MGAISRKATTVGVERIGYAEPRGDVMICGESDGGIEEAMRQNGHGIFVARMSLKDFRIWICKFQD